MLYMYDTCNYLILYYSKLSIVHPITTVLIVKSDIYENEQFLCATVTK